MSDQVPKRFDWRHELFTKSIAKHRDIPNAEQHLLEEVVGLRPAIDLDVDRLNRTIDQFDSIGLIAERRIECRTRAAPPMRLKLIDGLRRAVFGHDQKEFLSWLRCFHEVSHPRFLTDEGSIEVIQGLMAMNEARKRDEQPLPPESA